MVNILLVIHDKNSVDLIKALCLYKGCKVFVADNPRRLLKFLHEEIIHAVFFDKNCMYVSLLELIFSVYDYEMPAILISDAIDKPEEFEMIDNIFYRLIAPLNTDELDALIDAVINAVSPLRERIVPEKIIAENSGIKKKRMKMQLSTIPNFIYRNINNSDKKIIYSIRSYKFIKIEKIFSNVAKPFKKIDMVFTNMLKNN